MGETGGLGVGGGGGEGREGECAGGAKGSVYKRPCKTSDAAVSSSCPRHKDDNHDNLLFFHVTSCV